MSTTYILDLQQHFEAWARLGYRCVARNVATDVETDLGFIDADASPLQLAGLALADGTYDIIFYAAGYWWEDTRQIQVYRVTITGGAPPANPQPPFVANGDYELADGEVVLSWDYLDQLGAADPDDFALWFGVASPVDTSGDPDDTVTAIEPRTYRAREPHTQAGFWAIRARSGAVNGPVLEIQIPAPAGAITTPDNQRAIRYDEWNEAE